MIVREPTATEVKAYRDEHSVGMNDAKRILRRRAVEHAFDSIETLDDLKEVLWFVLSLI